MSTRARGLRGAQRLVTAVRGNAAGNTVAGAALPFPLTELGCQRHDVLTSAEPWQEHRYGRRVRRALESELAFPQMITASRRRCDQRRAFVQGHVRASVAEAMCGGALRSD